MGFFKKYNTQDNQRREKIKHQIDLKQKKLDPCKMCGLAENCLSPKMEYSGEGKKNILIIAKAPDQLEDKKGIQLIGDSGQELRLILNSFNFNLDVDAWKDYAIKCYSGGKKINNTQINSCRVNLLNTIRDIKPEKIITLGDTALKALIGDKISVGIIDSWVGNTIPDQELDCWLFPNYSMSYVLKNSRNKALEKIFKKSLITALNWDKPFIREKATDGVVLLLNELEVISFLEKVNKELISPIAIDFETTGKKPHAKGHKIKCISISTSKDNAFVFPVFNTSQFKYALKEVLTNKKIRKIGHNIKFESIWCKCIFGYNIEGWVRDTILACHILDNRERITGLKHQAYIKYGNIGYDKSVNPFLKSHSKDNNALNRIDECPVTELFTYCGVDTKYTYRLYEDLDVSNVTAAYNLFHQGTLEFAITEDHGIQVDSNYYEKKYDNLQTQIVKICDKLLQTDEAKLFTDKTGNIFNPKSPDDLTDLLFKYLKYKPIKKTSKDNDAADKEVLVKINTPFTQLLLEYKKLYKLRNTYLVSFIREPINNILRSSFNLNMVRTYRSSSSGPNFQNIPKRDKESQILTRRGIIARPGRCLLTADYSALEVAIGTCYHQDPVMINYLNDLNSNMHTDEAVRLFMLHHDEVTTNARYAAKNQFVFPEFYGSYYGPCSIYLWETVNKEKLDNGILIADHLKEKGITDYDSFENHIKKCEDALWKKYRVYKKWREDFWDEYQKKGYIKSHTGFIYSGLMKKKEVINYPIQGSAFHCLLWSYIKISQKLRANKMKSIPIGQIHDEIIIDAIPEEIPDIVELLNKIMCHDIKKFWKWIIIPLHIKVEVSKINGNWANMETYKEGVLNATTS